MPRANRYITAGRIYHVTHRCHDRAFLLKFGKDRDTYREMLRELLQESTASLLGYCLTSNHVHLLLTTGSKEVMARLMQLVAGDFAQAYNLRKHRGGAFWGDRYHATLVEGERHLWNCLKYIDLNMVRAGRVQIRKSSAYRANRSPRRSSSESRSSSITLASNGWRGQPPIDRCARYVWWRT